MSRLDEMNRIAAEHPEVGDVWVEMCTCFTCQVVSVGHKSVTIRKRDGEHVMGREDFRRWLHYGSPSINDKTWTDFMGKRPVDPPRNRANGAVQPQANEASCCSAFPNLNNAGPEDA